MGERYVVMVLALLIGCGDDPTSGTTRITAADGGEIASADGLFRLVVPPGALAADTDFSIRVLPSAEWPTDAATLTPLGGVYDIQPDGIEFLMPAVGIHELAPGALDGGGGVVNLATHVMRSASGEIEAAETTAFASETSTTIRAEIPHTSAHWVTGGGWVGRSDGNSTRPEREFRVGLRVEVSHGERLVGETWHATALEVHASEPIDLLDSRFKLMAGVISNRDEENVVPIVHPGWSDDTQRFVKYPFGVMIEKVLREAKAPALTGVAAPGAPVVIPPPLPGWHCMSQGRGNPVVKFGITSLEDDRATRFHSSVYIEGEATCTDPLAGAARDAGVVESRYNCSLTSSEPVTFDCSTLGPYGLANVWVPPAAVEATFGAPNANCYTWVEATGFSSQNLGPVTLATSRVTGTATFSVDRYEVNGIPIDGDPFAPTDTLTVTTSAGVISTPTPGVPSISSDVSAGLRVTTGSPHAWLWRAVGFTGGNFASAVCRFPAATELEVTPDAAVQALGSINLSPSAVFIGPTSTAEVSSWDTIPRIFDATRTLGFDGNDLRTLGELP